ncbi:MAG: molecular chaperone TorD family protein [Betaproteobacteria bacterium]|nr:molecular chaperone TorD family protein [Betaproteobacteria bacterium]
MNAAAAQSVSFESPRHLAPEDQVRADYYGLLSALYYGAPDARLLQGIVVSAAPDGEGELARAWHALAEASAVMPAEAIAEEYQELFVGIGRPPVMLFGSFYMAGFMNEKPLAELRTELARLGFQRRDGAHETEDHLAALCDVMRTLITGGLASAPATVEEQKRFFATHLQPWYERCCDATTANEKANYYRKVAALARAFFAIEVQAFDMP